MLYLFLLLFFITSCTSDESPTISGEKIWRLHNEKSIAVPQQTTKQKPYPWQKEGSEKLESITKEYFRCKGSSLHPPRIVLQDTKEIGRYYDCTGSEKHSLPLRDEKEFIYPILIELLNEVQKQTGKAVIITSGHRCPAHNAYVDSRPKMQSSKHLIGAEVDFYVQGMQERPEQVVQILCNYYKNQEKEYKVFTRYDKETDVSTAPWCNKEVFIKLYKSSEGRNFDNRHPYPYISIQVRFDKEKNEKVTFTHELAQQLLRK